MQDQSKNISYFCEDNEKLYFCILKLDSNFSCGRAWDANIESKHEIVQFSDLYKMIKPNSKQKNYNEQELKFHQTAPTLLDCGEEAGMFIVFSKFSYGELGPSIYFYSLKQQRVVSTVAGGEFFIDFVTDGVNKA